MEQLFDTGYQPVPGTQPAKYRTRSDEFCDRHLPAIQEPLLEEHGLAYAICIDRNGYVPTHNLAVSQPPTGELEHDLKFSRSKRIFDDPTGQRCGSHREPLLLQTYKRDTGEVMHDLSVPLMVAGRHWGGFRLGYRPVVEGGGPAPVATPREGEWLQAEAHSGRSASPRFEAAPLP